MDVETLYKSFKAYFVPMKPLDLDHWTRPGAPCVRCESNLFSAQDPMVGLPCGHGVHRSCAGQWEQEQATNPFPRPCHGCLLLLHAHATDDKAKVFVCGCCHAFVDADHCRGWACPELR